MAIQVWLRRGVCLSAAVLLFLMGLEGPFQGPPQLMGREQAAGEHKIQNRPPAKDATPAPNEDLVPLRVQRIVLINEMPAVLLVERGGNRFLLIFIDFFMAHALRSGIIGPQLERPLTHDLIGILLSRLGGKVNKITITELKDNTYYALISLQVNGRVEEIDARPSDALAIAVRSRAPIYADKSLLKPLPAKGEERKGTPPPLPKRPEPAKGST